MAYNTHNWTNETVVRKTTMQEMDNGIKTAYDRAENWDNVSKDMFKSASFAKGETTSFTAGQCQAINFADVIVVPNGYKVLTIEDDTYRANLISSPIRTRAGLLSLNYYAVTNINNITLRVKVIFVKADIYNNV